jgi:diguanylate cyclase (GGDEF)-like protein/PAS domain S-box-containing protein
MADKDKNNDLIAGEMAANYKDLVDNARDMIQCVDSEGKFVFVNQAWLSTLGYAAEEIKNITLWDIIHPDSMEHCIAVFGQVLTGKAYGEVEAIFVAKDGTPFMVEGNVGVRLDEKGRFVHTRGIFRDITNRKRAENINRLMFDISNAVATVHSLDELYQSIHTALGRVMDVTNFFIAIVDMQKRTLYFPYHVDTEDDDFLPITDFDPESSLTGLVVSKRRPIMYKREELEKRAQKGGVWGPVPQIWMGTPLMIEDEVIGIVAVQSYTDPDLYSEEDLRILSAVSDQMASAIARKRAEEALKAREEEYRQLYAMFRLMSDTMPDMLWAKDLDRKYIFANEAICKNLLNAKDTTEPIGKNDLYFASRERDAHPEQPDWHTFGELCMDSDSVTLQEMKPMQFDEYGNVKGKFLYLDVHKAPLFNDKGELIGVVGTARDVTAQKRNEEALRESEKKYRSLTENVAIGIYRNTPGPEGRFLMANPAFMELFGLESERELARIKVSDLYQDPSDRIAFSEMLLAQGRVKGVELALKCVNGTPIWGSVTAQVVYDEYGEVAWFDCTIEDITRRKQAEELLNMQNAMLRTQLEVSPDGIFVVDENEKIIAYNQKFCDIWGIPEEIMALERREKALDYVLPKLSDPEEFARRIHELYGNWQEKSYEEISLKDGRVLERYSAPMFGDEAQYYGRIWYYSDITERKKAEEALIASEEKYREILSTIEEGYYEVDLAGNFVFFNDSFWKGSGYSRDELMQGSYKKLYKNPQEVLQIFNRVYRTGKPEKAVDWPVITRDGREIFIELSVTLRRDEKSNPIGFRGITRDITERKLAEDKLREYEKLQQLLMDMATDLINVPLEKVDQAINEMLGVVGEFTKVDRVYVFKHDNNRRVTSNTHEWCAEDITSEIDNLQDFPLEKFADLFKAHQKGEIVNIPDVAMMPENHAMRPVFEAEGIQSLIMLPLFSEGVNTGFVGFDAVKQKKTFTEQEINLLKVLAEITSNVLARQKTESNIRYISFHDQLTGLYNRHYLEIEMERLDTARQLPLAVIMADLNGLKLVNDTYGHETGDGMLKTAATIIRNSCREEDIIARWGGDEFVVLLPQTAAEEARVICKRITESCRGAFVEDVPVSIALGIATKTSETKNLIETLQEAENEMYRQKLTESRSTKSAVVTSLLNTLAAKSFETEEHTRGMQKIAQKIGAKLNLPDSELHRLELLITLHDIGKINISEAILSKKSSLTDDEWEAIKKHPEIGCRIAMATEEFAHVAEDILAHHERWDGMGYPQGLKGSSISLPARIVAIADAYEVMSHGRPYKKAMSDNEIIAEFKRCSGNQFDPELAEILLSILEADQ